MHCLAYSFRQQLLWGSLGEWNSLGMIRDFNMAAFWAGVTAFVWYAFGAVPLHIAVIGQWGLNTAQASSWIFIV